MKKKFLGLFIILALLFVFVACGETEKKDEVKHEAATEWKSDETNHWHGCTVADCTEEFNKAAHEFGEGVVVTAPTKEAAGTMKYTCSVCGYEKTEEIAKLKNIGEVLAAKNNDEVELSGVVFAKTADAFYVSDDAAGICVKLSAANSAKLATLNVGDEVKVTGKFAISNNQPFVKNADVTVSATGKDALEAKADKFITINTLEGDNRANYGKLFTTVAGVSIDDTTKAIVLTDETGSVTLADANYSDYEKYVGKKVYTNYVLLSKGALNWTILALPETAGEYFVNIDDVKENIYGSIEMPTEVIGKLSLTTSYAAEPGVVFNWTVKDGTAITIENNIPTVDLSITEDANVTLQLELVSGETKATKDYTFTVKAVKVATLESGKTETDFVQIEALVVGAGVADEIGEYHYIIVMDEETKEFYLLDVSSAVRKTVAVGDKIKFVGKWHDDEDLVPETETEVIIKRPRYDDIQVIVKLSTGNAVDYSDLGAIRLEKTEDYQNAIDNNHELIKLYQIVNPFMVGSGTNNYNWNQFGPSIPAATGGLVNTRQFALLIRNLAENGLDTWESEYAVPTKSAGAKQYLGTVIYAFSVYQTGDTKWAFILPCKEACYYDVVEEINYDLRKSIPAELACTAAGNLTLLDKITIGETEYAITWTSSNPELLNAETGAYDIIYDPATITLTAEYTVGEETKSIQFTVELVCAEFTPLTCTEAIDAAVAAEGAATIKKVKAYVATLGASSENNANYHSGLFLTDGKKVIYFNTSEYTIGEHTLAIGDELLIENARVIVDNDGNTITDGVVSVVSSSNTIDYSELVIDATITNEEELVAFIGTHGVTHGLVVKFAGETMNMVGTGSTSATGRYQINYRNAGKSAEARYTFNIEDETLKYKTLCLNLPQTAEVVGSNWWEALGLPEKSGSKSYEFSGSFIAVGGYNGNTLHAWSVINAAEFKLTKVTDNILIGRELDKIETSFVATEAGTYTLVNQITIGEINYAITWTSENNAILNGDTGAYAAVTEETKVNLTAHYTYNDTEYTKTIEFTLTYAEPDPLTITEAKALVANDKVKATGAIIAFISDGNNTESNKGFLLMDNATGAIIQVRNIAEGATYPNYKYKGTETSLAIGDKVVVNGTIAVDGVYKYINLGATGDVTFSEKVTLNYHEGETGSDVLVVSTDAELDALIKNGGYAGKILKLVATAENPLHASGSGTKADTICNFKIGFHYTDSAITYSDGSKNRTISTKSDVNAPNTDGTTTFSIALYGATREDGKMGGSTDNQRVGNLYISICYTTSTYYQASIINFANCNLTAKTE